jgi:hypothetical protein
MEDNTNPFGPAPGETPEYNFAPPPPPPAENVFTPPPPPPAAPGPAFMQPPTPGPQPAPSQPVFNDTPPMPSQDPGGVVPQPVVQVLSPRGVEYVFLTITLFGGALGLISALISLVNGQAKFSVLAFPTAILLVSVPVFTALFLRLKNAELRDPSLALDASKRRSTQYIQIISFVVCFFTLIGFLATIFAKMAGNYGGSIGKVILDVLIILLVAGGILAYYWRDEHKG